MSVPITIPGNTITIPAQATNLVFKSIHIDKDNRGAITATITFNKVNATNQYIGSQQINLTGAQYNTFWAAWTTGADVYNTLSTLVSNFTAPTTVESDFLNVIPTK